MAKLISSPLEAAANKIVSLNRSSSSMRTTQTSYSEFLRFMSVETQNLKSIKFNQKKLKQAYNANVQGTFGNAGNLLGGLLSGGLDIGGFMGNFFGGGKKNKGNLLRAEEDIAKGELKALPKGQRFRIPGIKGIPLISTLLTGLDFAQRKGEGQTNLQAGAGAGGALAGSVLAGIVAAPLEAVPGVGFLLHGAAIAGGGYLGGAIADKLTGAGESDAKEKTQVKLKQLEQQQRTKASITTTTFPEVVDKFDNVIANFERAVRGGLLGPTSGASGQSTEGDQDPYEPELKSADNTNQNSGELGNYSVSGGSLPSSKRGSPFGPRGGRNHNGIDYPVPAGTPISVVQPGTISVADSNYDPGGWGALVEVQHSDGSSTRYAHLSQISVSKGQKIEAGTLIGKTGGKPGAPGAGNSRGEHLHYEYLPKGSGPRDPASGNNDDKYFRFGGNVTVKPKVSSQTGMMGQNGAPTVVLAAGTNTFGDPKKAASDVKKSVEELQKKGYNVVVVPPSEQGAYGNVSKAVQQAASASGASIEKGQYDPNDPTRAYTHLTPKEAERIKNKYKGATFMEIGRAHV